MAANPTTLERLLEKIRVHLTVIYGEKDHSQLSGALVEAMRLHEHFYEPAPGHSLWSEKDVAVITYGDTVVEKGGVPLQTLHGFLRKRFADSLTIVHVLPYFPWTSDDGFAVSDYTQVKPELGDWDDIGALAKDYRIMSDLVVNHCSASHEWFQQYQRGEEPGKRYFVEATLDEDLSSVVRPRVSPLRRPTNTPDGVKQVWCTFGHDQIDLNFAEPDLLVELVRIIRNHLDKGVSIFRLDAVAFIWKERGTPCVNLPQTHELVRLMRTLIEHVKPDAVIITETNIPNRENLSYFGNLNEAHSIYNFSLPPLLLHGLVTGSVTYLKRWLMSMPPAQLGTVYFNFIASHDGIGLRPAEGLLSDAEVDQLVGVMRESGGRVSERTLPDGSTRPYEINISLYDAFQRTIEGEDLLGHERFICAHSILLALEGIPAFYIHSLLGTRNDTQRVAETGINRHINRHQWQLEEIEIELDKVDSPHAQVLTQLLRLIDLRKKQTAFHPNALQFTLHISDEVFAFFRQSYDRKQSIFCLFNMTSAEQAIPMASINLTLTEDWLDLISGEMLDITQSELQLAPYQAVWLSSRPQYLPFSQ